MTISRFPGALGSTPPHNDHLKPADRYFSRAGMEQSENFNRDRSRASAPDFAIFHPPIDPSSFLAPLAFLENHGCADPFNCLIQCDYDAASFFLTQIIGTGGTKSGRQRRPAGDAKEAYRGRARSGASTIELARASKQAR